MLYQAMANSGMIEKATDTEVKAGEARWGKTTSLY